MQKTGNNIKYLRKQMKLNQRELGELIGVSQTSVAHYEAGTREPNIETLLLLSQIFEESLDVIIGNTRIINKDETVYSFEDIREDLINSLLKKDERTFFQLIKNNIIEHYSIEFIIENIIRDIQYQIGDLWYEGKITEADEHYITNQFRKFVSYISVDNVDGIKNKSAVSMSVDSEKHTLGIEMINIYLESLGVKPIYLGNSVQFSSFIKLLDEYKPDYIFLSITISDQINHLIALVEHINERFPDEYQIVIGGQGIRNKDQLEQYPNVTCISALSEVKALVNS